MIVRDHRAPLSLQYTRHCQPVRAEVRPDPPAPVSARNGNGHGNTNTEKGYMAPAMSQHCHTGNPACFPAGVQRWNFCAENPGMAVRERNNWK